MKIALVHDYLREYGGAERVVEVLHEMWPQAPLYTSFVDWKSLGVHADRFRNWDIRTSWVQKNPFVKKWHSPLRFLTPWVWKYFDFTNYDVVISSSGWFISRGIDVKKPTVHISYIHHPPRNLYGYATGSSAQSFPAKAYATVINPFLRMYDYHAAQKPDFLIANSQETRRRIKKFYRRDATVIYPPIEIKSKVQSPASPAGRQKLKVENDEYFLSVGRLTYAKRIDLIIEACRKTKQRLIVVGAGRDESTLNVKAQMSNVKANPKSKIQNENLITFKGSVTDEELHELYAGAKALIFAAIDEDFGMVPVESMAAGTPVIAYRSGGVMETVIDGKTGLFFDELSLDSLTSAIRRFNDLHHHNKQQEVFRNACVKQAQKFSKDRFKKEIREFILHATNNG